MNPSHKSEIQLRFDTILEPGYPCHYWRYSCKAVGIIDFTEDGEPLSLDEMIPHLQAVLGRYALQLTHYQVICWHMLAHLDCSFADRYFIMLQRTLFPDGCPVSEFWVGEKWLYAWLRGQVYSDQPAPAAPFLNPRFDGDIPF